MNNNAEQNARYQALHANPDMHRKWDAYRHPHIKYYEHCKATLQKKILAYADMLATERGRINVPAVEEFLAVARGEMACLEAMRERGYFAGAEQCGDKDYWIDTAAYHSDRADACFAAVRSLEALKAHAKTTEDLALIQAEIERQTAFAYGALKRAGGQHWFTQGKIREMLGVRDE